MATKLFTLSLLVLSLTTLTTSHNITQILSQFPEYSSFNSYLTQTKLADEINARQTITVLAVTNNGMSSLTSNHPLSVVKNALSLHVLLDYYDPTKLHQLANGTTLTTTLYQTTGSAQGNLGFVNITDLSGGKVGFGSAAPGSKLDSTYTKSVKQLPYNISVVGISAPIIAPGILTAPAPSASDVNITALLEKAGCKTFVSLILKSGVLKIIQDGIDSGKGLTVFAPSDEAFKARGVPDLSKLKNNELVQVLQYHAAQGYNPIGTLKNAKTPIATLASKGAGTFELMAKSAGDSVSLDTGVDSSRVASTLLDFTPVAVFTIDNVLLPSDVFGKAPSPAPAMEPVMAPSPDSVMSPSPGPVIAKAPSPMAISPPTPLMTPEGAPGPAEAPEPASDRITSGSGDVHVKMFEVVLSVFASFVISMLS